MAVKTQLLNKMPAIIADDILVFDPNGGVVKYANCISGSFSDNGKPVSIMVNHGKTIRNEACHAWLGYPETVINRYKDGSFGFGKFKTANEIPKRDNVIWAVGGMGLLNLFNPAEEGFCKISKNGMSYNYTDVLRDTNHTLLGIKNGLCYLVYAKSMTAVQVNAFAKECGFTSAIMMDGGHIAAINGSSGYAKINTKQMQAYAIQGISTDDVKQYSLKRDGNTYVSRSFKVKEFACRDGSDLILISTRLVNRLQQIRDHFSTAVTINSGFRTKKYNKEVGGVADSQHLLGKAADITVARAKPSEVAEYAESIGTKGVGRYYTFTHIDERAGDMARWRG